MPNSKTRVQCVETELRVVHDVREEVANLMREENGMRISGGDIWRDLLPDRLHEETVELFGISTEMCLKNEKKSSCS